MSIKGEYFTPPSTRQAKTGRVSVFLAGSIEMGAAEDWQAPLAEALTGAGADVFSPRRADWDPTWSHDPSHGSPFRGQVEWELDHIYVADLIVMNILAGTVSPISLLELGMILRSGKRVVLRCEEEYFRRGNVVITAERFGVNVLGKGDDLTGAALAVLRGIQAS